MNGGYDVSSGDSDDEIEDSGLVAPAFHMYVGTMYDGEELASTEQLAIAFGAAVYEPTWWPESTGEPRYILAAPPPEPLPHFPHYRIVAECSDRADLLVVSGRFHPPPVGAGQHGWYAHPELIDVKGLALMNVAAHVVVEHEDQFIDIGSLPSMADAVHMAQSLRRVPPAG